MGCYATCSGSVVPDSRDRGFTGRFFFRDLMLGYGRGPFSIRVIRRKVDCFRVKGACAMGRIRVLPDHLANQIAAGEVVERPASALKELLENCLDAGADRIRVVLENGGKKRIRVEDNGCGMDRDDCLMALERHATSKLTRAEDLFSIRTLGFRGEALPSIASVSQMTVESRPDEADSGVRVVMRGAKMVKVEEIPMNRGTAITVDHLFFNIPARKKFLRKTETELGWMMNLVTQYSMAHLDKHFSLDHNGRTLIDAPPVATLKERIYQHFGKSMLDDLIPFEYEREWLRVGGLASSPALYKNSRQYQYLFVNGRLVRDKVLTHAFQQAYEGFGEGKIFPVMFMFLEIPSEEVDVNVHPAKTEVKFIHANFVHDAVRDAVREALLQSRVTIPYRFRDERHAHPVGPPPSAPAGPFSRTSGEMLPGTAPPSVEENGSRQQAKPLPWQKAAPARDLASGGAGLAPADQSRPVGETAYDRFLRGMSGSGSGPAVAAAHAAAMEGAVPEAASEKGLFTNEEVGGLPRLIGQFRDSYILAEHEGDLLLIDQHVAHERLLYDQIKKGLEDNSIESQALLVPVTVELSPGQAVELEHLMPTLQRFGFDLDPFDAGTFVVREMPNFAKGQDLAHLVEELVEKAQGMRDETALEAMIDLFAATKACKAAVKINMRLTPEKMNHFIEKLWASSSPMFCPHGRPIILRFSNMEIEKNFLRR